MESDVFASDESRSENNSDCNNHSSSEACAQATEPLLDKKDKVKGNISSLLTRSGQSLANTDEVQAPLLDTELVNEQEEILKDSSLDYLNLKQKACDCVESDVPDQNCETSNNFKTEINQNDVNFDSKSHIPVSKCERPKVHNMRKPSVQTDV